MLPTVLSHELTEGIETFLRATFPASTPAFRRSLDEILTGTGRDRLFQGPYLRIGLPFLPGTIGRDFFPRLKTAYPPYVHQERAWTRLRTESGSSTLIATGTGSGKTECFTYPILDHILAHPAQRGIKAIVLYPMNALATDQARRFANEIHETPALRGKVRVGLYVGGEPAGGGNKTMGEHSVITSREEMRKSPPDILMTNYKMLDYLLLRQPDRGLWSENQPDTLRYLVVDELHTFDGAQGTDLGCLIRRVKARLKTPAGHLCCVGTSATLGGPESKASMVEFAEQIFGESFPEEAVILETRKSPQEHIENEDAQDLEILFFEPPGPDRREELLPANYGSIGEFIGSQSRLWFGESIDASRLEDRVKLAHLLRRHNFLRTFLGYFRNGVLEEAAILAELKNRRSQWAEEHLRLLLNSFVSLCAVARDAPRENAYFLQIRAELWMRELRRMVASVSPRPALRFSMDLPADHPQKHLAAMHCRDCGAMGWGGLQKSNEDQLLPDLDRFYQGFFSRNPDPRLRFVFPVDKATKTSDSLVDQYLCGACLTLFESADGKCPRCGTMPATGINEMGNPFDENPICTFRVESPVRTIQRDHLKVADKSCPYCDSSTGLTIVGSQAASLTAVGLSQIFGSPYNDDKKAMAFSDSVQDASHRAGFFSGRTYQIGLRTALCQTIDEAAGDLTLAELSQRFPRGWLERLGRENFVGTFIPPTIEWWPEFEMFKEERRLSPDSKLPYFIAERLEWEVIREFGLQSRIGRTLEKSAAAAVYLCPDTVAAASARALETIHDLGAPLSVVNEADVDRLIIGICERLRSSGGISHRFLKSYLEKRGDTFVFNEKIAGGCLPPLPKPQRPGRRPVFFATFYLKDSFERLVASGTTATWTEHWVEKWLRQILGDRVQTLTLSPIIEAITGSMTQAALWDRHEVSARDGEVAWGLHPERIFVSGETTGHACGKCGHQVTTATAAAPIWLNLPCLRHRCDGTYRPLPDGGRTFFGDLYRKGDIVRLRACEHTGLLDRETREKVEREFMRYPRVSTDANLLSCTPTMEMGVDVGDLSTVLLCSVPPEQANYLQRVGRGGRRDGNSLALTVANAEPHDLTYYEEPLEMLAGDVRLPAVFLRAPAVLERQLTAYCIDRWIESDPAAQIPREMEAIYIHLSKAQDGGGAGENLGVFPKALYHFIELRQTELAEGFVEMFSRNELDQASVDYLRKFIQGDNDQEGSLSFKINRKLAAAYKDREALYSKRKKLKVAMKANEAKQPRDERLDQDLELLKAEHKGISRLLKEINGKQTLNFLTDEGLIPNYAFPEEGVTLRSVILKKPTPEEGDQKLIKLEFEHMRPAEAALTELAPGSSFYVEGRKLTVDQVSIDQDDYEEWHFCRSCSHMEPISTKSESYTACPRCGCAGWSDNSLRQRMLKMRQVFVTAWDRNTRTLDQKDDRDLASFNKQTSISYEKEAIRRSYVLRAEGSTFAFDFIDLITLRETNFGEERPDADSLQIGGKTLHGVGFRVCRSCGKIQQNRDKDKPKHDISCRYYGKDADSEEFERTFLLYRQLQSEAIRLLIPSLNQDDSIDTQSFVAAVHLGLKERFGGHLSHLKLSVQHQPIAGSSLRCQHVFIYDSVPGGTGYLKDLTRDESTLIDVLERAYAALESCRCKDNPALDGCYRCIKAYRFRYVHNQISRQTAVRQIKRILDHRDAIEERSPDDSLINPLLESELERRFIETLRQTEGFVLNPEVVNGRPGYLLRVGKAAWKVIPQVELGPSDGIAISTRPDFVLQPVRPGRSRPISVFLDGFAFHADMELDNNRIADDIAKRNAVRRSGRYLVWSLTWADLKGSSPPDETFLGGAYGNFTDAVKRHAPELAGFTIFQSPAWNSWDLLICFLRHQSTTGIEPPTLPWSIASSLLSCNFPQRGLFDDEGLRSALESLVLGESPSSPAPPQGTFAGALAGGPSLRSLAAIPVASLQQRTFAGAIGALWFDDEGDKPADEFQSDWRELLRANNLLQFLPRFACVTRRMLNGGGIGNLVDWLLEADTPPSPKSVESDKMTSDQWEELELIDASLHHILIPLLKTGDIPWPEVGYELTSDSGRCEPAMIELAWPDRALGVALPGDGIKAFEQQGWTILPSEGLTVQSLISYLNSRS